MDHVAVGLKDFYLKRKWIGMSKNVTSWSPLQNIEYGTKHRTIYTNRH